MAYLRGNTYVDGTLNVEGSLIIDSVASSSGNVPFYIDTSVKSKVDSILKVKDSDGAIASTDLYATEYPASETADGLYLEYSLKGKGSKIYLDNTLTKKADVLRTEFRLDVSNMEWRFYDIKGVYNPETGKYDITSSEAIQ